MTKSYLALATGVSALALSTAAFGADGHNEIYTNQNATGSSISVTQGGDYNNAGVNAGQALRQTGSGESLVINQSGHENRIGKAFTSSIGTGPNAGVELSHTEFGSSQSGSNNSLRLDQSAGPGNWIAYTQEGKNNGNITAGASNGTTGMGSFESPNYSNASINATGKWNYVNQNGSGGDIVIRQKSSGPQATAGNGVIANQGGSSNGIDLTQTTNFNGSNLAYFDQRQASLAIASIKQEHNFVGTSQANLVDVRQSGDDSKLSAQQAGEGLDLFAVQKGNVFAETNQIAGAYRGGIVLRQTSTGFAVADRNYVYAYQGSTGPGLFSGFNSLTVDQVGVKDDIRSTQTSDNNVAIFSQTGHSDVIDSTQRANAYVNVTQSGGNENKAANTQSGGGAHGATATQTGSKNTLTTIQSGTSANRLTSTQTGNTNLVDNTQTGTGGALNELTVLQVGDTLKAYSTQNGYAITAYVDQNGANNTYTGNQSGFSQTATVFQGASFNVANVVQAGSSNTTTIRQNR